MAKMQTVEAKPAQKRYPNDIDPVLGYAPGTIICDELADYRGVRVAEEVLLYRYKTHGLGAIFNLTNLVDNCMLPDYFRGPEFTQRFLAGKLSEERLDRLAKRHLGGDEGFSTLAFNRTTAANLTVLLALVPPGSTVVYLVPEYPKPSLQGHGHPSIPRAVELAGATTEVLTTVEEMRECIARGGVSLIALCPSYRGLIKESPIEESCKEGKAHGIPIFVDDASGARTRVVGEGQRRAIDLGADVVVTSCEKYGLNGPRAGLLVGRKDLMERIGAKAAVLGTESRPSVTAAIVRCLEEYSDEKAPVMYRDWERRHQELYEVGRQRFGDRLLFHGHGGVSMPVEDMMELVLERAGIEETEFAPVDVSTAHAMVLLRKYGYVTVPALHYPGASKVLSLQLASESSQRLSPREIIEAVDDAFDEVAKVITARERLEQILSGPPDWTMTAGG